MFKIVPPKMLLKYVSFSFNPSIYLYYFKYVAVCVNNITKVLSVIYFLMNGVNLSRRSFALIVRYNKGVNISQVSLDHLMFLCLLFKPDYRATMFIYLIILISSAQGMDCS